MLKKIFNKIKRLWCTLKCCFESKCNIEANDKDGDGIPDEITINRRNSV